jgi:hypothetical protein
MSERFRDLCPEVALADRFRSSYLLAALVLFIMLTPLFEGTRIGHIVEDGLLSLVLLATVYAASDNGRTRIIALVLAISAMLLLWTNIADPSTPGRLAGLTLYVLLNFAAIGMVLRRIVLAPTVSAEILCAGISLYLLIGVNWALTYMLIDTIDPGTFESLSLSFGKGKSEFLYFSFATLTTLGYGDISPNTPFGRIWAVMEAVTGVLYIAILVARLVSLYRS